MFDLALPRLGGDGGAALAAFDLVVECGAALGAAAALELHHKLGAGADSHGNGSV